MKYENAFTIAVMGIAFLGVLTTGLASSTPMIGDEVTHYYFLENQASDLTTLNFTATIPTAYGSDTVRKTTHTILWHYLGAMFYKAIPSFKSVQIFHCLFFIQLLLACYFLVKIFFPHLDRSFSMSC